MVLMDECHHAGADTDTAVLRSVTAKYVYGLTATPKRDDGQDRKIFLQLGPIRFRYTAKDRAKKQGIGHYVYPRFTRFVHLSEKPPAMAELNQLVIESEDRNAQILSDTITCVQNGRTPLVMTKYTPPPHCHACVGSLCGFRSSAERAPAGSPKTGRCADVREHCRHGKRRKRTAAGGFQQREKPQAT